MQERVVQLSLKDPFRWYFLVELRGIEPLTSSMRTKRATNCATAPCHRLSGARQL